MFKVVRCHSNKYCGYWSDKYRRIDQRCGERESNKVTEADIGK